MREELQNRLGSSIGNVVKEYLLVSSLKRH
jgi:hypothetical protein